jgi:Rad3-related DNA helicase
MFNTNDILVRLQNGEKIEDIGNEIAGMMNQAVAQHQAEQEAIAAKEREAAALAEKEEAKRDLIEELVEIVQELAILEGMDPDELNVTDEDIDQMVAAFTEMFEAMRELKKFVTSLEDAKTAAAPVKAPTKITPSDEQILADFIKMFN